MSMRHERKPVAMRLCFLETAGFILWMLLFPFAAAAAYLPATPPALIKIGKSSSSSMTTTNLCMNKKSASKKVRSTASSSPQGFAAPQQQPSSFPYAGKLRPGLQSPQKTVVILDNNKSSSLHNNNIQQRQQQPDYAISGMPSRASTPRLPWMIEVKNAHEIECMRRSGRLAREILDLAGRAVAVGVTTDAIDEIVHTAIVERGAYPSPLNYHGFPKSCCTSVNEVICHGIPDDRPLENGDIINIDITVYKDGFHGDCSEMFVVGQIDAAAQELLQCTYDCWIAACQIVAPGKDYKDIGGIIEDIVSRRGFSTVRNFCGHGIGQTFHTNPNILHYRNNEPNGQMAAGHTFTIEPMICEGSAKALTWPDEWTATTTDGKRSAQFEHTLLITNDGVEALTGKTSDSMLQFWERNSNIHQGVWLGTSQGAMARAEEINAKLLSQATS